MRHPVATPAGVGQTTDGLGGVLLVTARSAIVERFGLPGVAAADHDALSRPAATFVTLKRHGELRGCIGSLEPLRPLRVDVRENAIAAAFRDPRFAPLALSELHGTTVEVSLLSGSEAVEAADEDDLIARLRPGQDGLTLRCGELRATFLPQVWEMLADPREFLRALKRKAGLPIDFWSAELRVSRYRVSKWSEEAGDAWRAAS